MTRLRPCVPTRRGLTPRAGLIIVAVGTVIGLATTPAALVGCATTKHVATTGKDAVVQCVKADSAELLQLTGELAAAAVASALKAGTVDWDALVAKAKAAGLEVGGCAFAALYKALDKEPEVAARSSVPAVDPRRAALEQLRAQLGGARWQLGDGSVL
jgi:hypothetical protein